MAKRVNPTLSTYQERIIIAKADMDGVSPAQITKELIGQGIVILGDRLIEHYQKHYIVMTEEKNKSIK